VFAGPRYIATLRDLAQWVHVDALYQAYHQACLILLGMAAPFDAGNPYHRSDTQIGFGTFGAPHVLSLVTEVATRALKAAWCQKWLVHRRLRPEAMGGLVHHRRAGTAAYPIHADALDAQAVERTRERYGTWLLPCAYPEGSPAHPSYPAGHATVAGACVTILKAWFDESFVLPDPVVADDTGSALLPYLGPDLTIGNELNKLAANVSMGRNAAGIHYRSDYWESLRLGESVALAILEEQRATYNEEARFTLTTFDGAVMSI
jgi:membrane-associated phospholipid phosphatase